MQNVNHYEKINYIPKYLNKWNPKVIKDNIGKTVYWGLYCTVLILQEWSHFVWFHMYDSSAIKISVATNCVQKPIRVWLMEVSQQY